MLETRRQIRANRKLGKVTRAEIRKSALADKRPPTRLGRIGATANEALAIANAIAGIAAAMTSLITAYRDLRPKPAAEEGETPDSAA